MAPRIEEKFLLSPADIFHNPYYIIRSGLYKSVKKYAPLLQGHLMDFGCGTKPYESLFVNVTKYIGVDFEGGGNDYKNTRVDVYYDGKSLPFENDHFDSILSTEVLEHVFNPDDILSELNRVLKPNGMMLLTCPFLWPEHEQPWDYARYSSFGLKHLLEKKGFEVVSQEKTGNFISGVVQMIVLYIYMFIPKVPGIKQLLFFIFCFPFHLLHEFLNLILPAKMKRKDLYLNNVILVKKRTETV